MHRGRTANRSLSAEVHIGGGVQSLNLACSGAQTSTHTADNGDFKPGLAVLLRINLKTIGDIKFNTDVGARH